MKKSSVKRLLVLFTLITIVGIAITTNVNASGASPLNIIMPGTTNQTTTNSTTTNTTTNTATTNTVANIIGTNQNSNLPQTGDASDYAIFLFIAVCAVVAIFAYKKYKNYNI